tara:strand:+ start:1765 stop:3111 length:1347 start_codon:yes stop_codon:yes gene_type:complete
MRNARDLPQAIQWHEGMLLAPQHFQQSFLRQESLLHYHLTTGMQYHWGLRRVRIDPALLVSGVFRVTDLEAVMPDGLVVSHDAQLDGDLEVDLTPFEEGLRDKPILLYLVVPAEQPGGASVAGSLPRYESAEGPSVVDENTGEGDLRIPRLRPRLSLLVVDKPPQKYVGFPLAQIVIRNDAYSLTDFIPPLLHVPTQTPLGELCSQVAAKLREKASFLSERARAPGSEADRPMLLETDMLIRALCAQLPMFEAVLNTGVAHPYPLFLGLTGVAGSVSTLGVGGVPPVFPTYNHNDLRYSFGELSSYVFRMIDTVHESFRTLPFDLEENEFSVELQPDWIGDRLVIGARGQIGATEGDMIGWLNEALIGSSDVMRSLRERRILGADRRMIDAADEMSLSPSRGVVLFEIKPSHQFVRPGEKLLITNTSDRVGVRRPSQIVLYVANRGAG